MAIDEVLKKATIKFPRAIGIENARELILYISEKLPGRINFSAKQYYSAGDNEEEKKFKIENGTLEISGNIIPSKNPMEFDTFQLKPWEEDTSYVSSLEFQLVPDWEIRDYHRVEPLWNNVRKIVDDYFREKLRRE